MTDTPAYPWWHGATIYQIYPRSFADTNGDGIGDLPGITAHLDHVASLGIDALWISPFFTSPMADFGYDVADYRDVDPIFGTLVDFDALIARAHDLDLRVIIDLVFAHTSDKHAWFTESRAGGAGTRGGDEHGNWAMKDWYVWADPKPDGTPPNNWQSVFGGPAWTWDARRGQYYYHQFLKEQPQLNVHNPEVQDALLEVVGFWLARGVDGFRFDALNHAMFDPKLRDNPVAPPRENGAPRSRSYDFQRQTHSMGHPDVVGFVERIAAVCADNATPVFNVAEVGGADPVPLMQAYTAGDNRLSSAYSFEFLYAPTLTGDHVAAALAQWHGHAGRHRDDKGLHQGWPSWAFENHDAPRCVSRWAVAADRPAFARVAMALLMALRGNAFVYQGQELGLEQDDIPFELLQDPEAIANWPLTLSRDGCRTPMPWSPGHAQGGFTTGTPWLPLSAGNIAKGVSGQESDEGSLLHLTRAVIAARRASAVMRHGGHKLLVAEVGLVAFRRTLGGESVVCVFNLSTEAVDWPEDVPVEGEVLLAVNGASAGALPGFGGVWLKI